MHHPYRYNVSGPLARRSSFGEGKLLRSGTALEDTEVAVPEWLHVGTAQVVCLAENQRRLVSLELTGSPSTVSSTWQRLSIFEPPRKRNVSRRQSCRKWLRTCVAPLVQTEAVCRILIYGLNLEHSRARLSRLMWLLV